MNSLLMLIDLQKDFLQRPDLVPRPDRLVRRVERLLEGFRKFKAPIVHVWTQITQDGSNRMPHWKRQNTWACVEGTPGVLPPESLQPQPDELVFTKQYFSAFSIPSLHPQLQAQRVDSIVLCGIFLHGCIRSTALDAYEKGYEVWIADEAVGSYDPGHGEITRLYLNGRAANFSDTPTILSQIEKPDPLHRPQRDAKVLPVAHIGGKWIEAKEHAQVDRHNPSHWEELISSVPLATLEDVNFACTQASTAQQTWKEMSPPNRAEFLHAWAEILVKRQGELAQLLAREIGKPLQSGQDEIQMAISFIHQSATLCLHPQSQTICPEKPIHVRHCPVGVIGLVTPWNNPVAIPVGKISPALAFGNTAVWKPAVEAPQTAMSILEALYQAGAPPGLVNLVFGEEATARKIITHPGINAISFTGSTEVGQAIATLCAYYGKPLQAELGGNNAAIVCRDYDVRKAVHGMALSAFSFSGQRCTSIQRFLVERPILQKFQAAFVEAVTSLIVGDPFNPETTVGPLISRSHQQWIQSLLDEATLAGAEILCGGTIPHDLQNGCWLTPAVINQVGPTSFLSQREIFGPVAVIDPVEDLEEAIEQNNHLQYGLVASLYTHDESKHRRFLEAVESGMVNVTHHPFTVHPSAPFGGWKGSRVGPPEHGVWDQHFYTRPQTIYGKMDSPS